MERKSSKVVIFCGLVFIFFGLVVLVATIQGIKVAKINFCGNLEGFLLGSICFLTGLGLLALKEWGRKLVLILATYLLIMTIIGLPADIKKTIGVITEKHIAWLSFDSLELWFNAMLGFLVSIGLVAWLFGHFTDSKVKEQFKR